MLAWVVREGATNAIRHSGATHAAITLRAVTDDRAGDRRRRARRAGPRRRRPRAHRPARARAVGRRHGRGRGRPGRRLPRDGASPGVIRVLLAEDQAMVRGALARLLALEDDIEVVAQVGRGDEVLEAARRAAPDVALLDIGMPGLDGLEVAELLRDALPEVRVLILTTFGRPGYLRRAMEAGAAGFLLKDGPPRSWRARSAPRPPASGSWTPAWPPPPSAGREPAHAARARGARGGAPHGTVAEIAAALYLSRARRATTSPRSCRSSTRTAASRRSAWPRSAAGSSARRRSRPVAVKPRYSLPFQV